MSAGLERRPDAASGALVANVSTMRLGVQSRRSSTCKAVMASTGLPPALFTSRWTRTDSRMDAAISIMPSMWQAMSRTDQSGQSVAASQSPGENEPRTC